MLWKDVPVGGQMRLMQLILLFYKENGSEYSMMLKVNVRAGFFYQRIVNLQSNP